MGWVSIRCLSPSSLDTLVTSFCASSALPRSPSLCERSCVWFLKGQEARNRHTSDGTRAPSLTGRDWARRRVTVLVPVLRDNSTHQKGRSPSGRPFFTPTPFIPRPQPLNLGDGTSCHCPALVLGHQWGGFIHAGPLLLLLSGVEYQGLSVAFLSAQLVVATPIKPPRPHPLILLPTDATSRAPLLLPPDLSRPIHRGPSFYHDIYIPLTHTDTSLTSRQP